MKQFDGRVAVVTGAGSGIGRATAQALAAEGARVVASDVDPASAQDTAAMIEEAGGEAQAFELDVTLLDQIEGLRNALESEIGAPSILVNNAGIAVGAYFGDTSRESWERVLSINLMGVVNCCRALVPLMVGNGQAGHVVNIASMLGFTPAKGVSAYATTKFGVLGFSECLRAELAEHGIGVTAICPGIIRTNIINSGVLESNDEDIEEKRRTIDELYEKRNYPPGKVAQAVVSSIRRNRAVVPVSPEAWLAYYLKRWTPWLLRGLARKIDI